MLYGHDEPEIEGLVWHTMDSNPDCYWDGTNEPEIARVALGIASWIFDGHIDTMGDIQPNEQDS